MFITLAQAVALQFSSIRRLEASRRNCPDWVRFRFGMMEPARRYLELTGWRAFSDLGSFRNFHGSALGGNFHRQRRGDVFALPPALQAFKLLSTRAWHRSSASRVFIWFDSARLERI
jgi:hypothetical protein